MTVSIQGYRGSFHHIVATQLWGTTVKLVERDSFEDVFNDVLSGTAPIGIVAIENSITGSIAETLDLLNLQPVTIVGEIILPIQQNLVVVPGTKIEQLKTIYSHPVAIKQCFEFFKKYPYVKLKNSEDTGKSVKNMMKKGNQSVGSIASTLAAQIYGAEVITHSIESNHLNFTRFLLITKPDTNVSELLVNTPLAIEKVTSQIELKASLILDLLHQPGSLAKCLDIIARMKANLARIESRPILGKPWEYLIYIDLIIPNQKIIDQITQAISPLVMKISVKGIYPVAFEIKADDLTH